MGAESGQKKHASRGRRESEKTVFRTMVSVYCRAHHRGHPVCTECAGLIQYAEKRIEACRFGDAKTFCSACTVHCFQPAHRTRVREVMRYAGPRMLLYHPVMAIRHLLQAGG